MTVAKGKSQVEDGRVQLIHEHVCINCGQAVKREEVDSRQVASGIFHCPKCGLEGPLNVEIRNIGEVDVNDNDSKGR